ncbi:MAG: DUF3500 domain-containing protein [Planctomycetota bacterium]|nr:DUF3500 domain-containing protein [Planctomycetota bacterium]
MKSTAFPRRHRLLTNLFLSTFLFVPILISSLPGITGSEKGVQIPQQVANRISDCALALLEALDEEQRGKIHFVATPGSPGSEALSSWTYFPGDRPGLKLNEMKPEERVLAQRLVRSALSDIGQLKWNAIVAVEHVLQMMSAQANRSGKPDPNRDPGLYTFAIFGNPSTDSPWGWRVEGHHISIKFLFDGDQLLSSTPAFLGTAPTVLLMGPNTGTEILDEEEELALTLMRGLTAAQKKIAIQDDEIPRDVITGPGHPDAPDTTGIARDQLDPSQKILLEALLDSHLGILNSSMEAAEKSRIAGAKLDKIHFAWWGPIEKEKRHSYRIQGPTFVVELVRTTGDPGHIHIVRRDPSRDLDGAPMLQHLRQAHGE